MSAALWLCIRLPRLAQEAAAVAGLAAARLENLDLDASQLLDAGEA